MPAHTSFSQLATYAGCGLQYRYQYVDRLTPVDDESLPTEAGTAIHTAIDEYERRRFYESLVGTQVNIDLVTLAQHHFLTRNEIFDARQFGKQDLNWWLAVGIPARCESYLAWSEQQREEGWAWYSTDPVSVEVPLTATWGGAEYTAYADRIVVAPDESIVIDDLKTGKPKPTHRLQVNLYLRAFLRMFSEDEQRVYGRAVYLGNDGVTVETFPLTLTEDGAEELFRGLVTAKERDSYVATGVFNDACKWCPFKGECPVYESTDAVGVLI